MANNTHVLLKKLSLTPRPPTVFLSTLTSDQVASSLPTGELTAVDFETTGTDLSDPAVRVLGLGWANKVGCFYAPVSLITHDILDALLKTKLTAFNVLFDGTALRRMVGHWVKFEWCTYGLYRQLATEGFFGQRWNLEKAMIDLLGWEVSGKDELSSWLKANKLSKGDMEKVPVELLGRYCAMDAEAALQLMEVFQPLLTRFPQLENYHRREFMTEVRLLSDQWMRGIAVDVPHLTQHIANLESARDTTMARFLTHPAVAAAVEEWRTAAYEDYKTKSPKGKLTRDDKRFRFNPNSKAHLGWLLYDRLGFECENKTETGRREVSKKLMPSFGEHGQALAEYNKIVKELGYAKGLLEHTRDGVFHPQYKCPGTVTGRIAGGGACNQQQFPKTSAFLQSFVARPGMSIVATDYSSLEPRVLTELSRDGSLLKVYGPDAPPCQDIYLMTGANLPGLGEKIRASGYDPDNPTPESVAAAKKQCKKERTVAKIVVLSSNYSAGPAKIAQTLTLSGIPTTEDEARVMHTAYWDLYRGVKRLGFALRDEWQERGGWIYTGVGLPHVVAEEVKKDLVNRTCQLSGHVVLQKLLWHIDRLVREVGLDAHPVDVDTHDSTAWECPDDKAWLLKKIFEDASQAVNDELGGKVPLVAVPGIYKTIAEFKLEE